MEELLSVYRQTLAEDIKDKLQQANAYTLQRKLYDNSDVFGQLSKYDFFHKAFGVPPNPCESVTFLRFWQGESQGTLQQSLANPFCKRFHYYLGVEKAFSDPEPMMNGPRSFELQKALFVDSEHLNTMRYFRDEILKQQDPMPLSSFLSIIDSCSYNAENRDFWLRTRANSCETFSTDGVHLTEISDMVLGHLSQTLSIVKKRTIDLRTMSTCDPLEEEDKLVRSSSDLSIVSLPTYHSVNSYAEERYIKLLEELDACLPALYNKFCDEMEQLKAEKSQMETLCEEREKAIDELSAELSSTRSSLQSRCDTLQECNTLLKRKMESKDLQLESYRIQVENLERRMANASSSRCNEEERQGYTQRCSTLEQENNELKKSLEALKLELKELRNKTSSRVDIGVGSDDGYASTEHKCETWETSQEREQLFQQLEQYQELNSDLNAKAAELEKNVMILSQGLVEATNERLKCEERLKEHVPLQLHITEIEQLKERMVAMETTIAALEEEIAKKQTEYRIIEEERDILLSAKSKVELERDEQKGCNATLESQMEAMRYKCMKNEEEAALSSELQAQLEEIKICNSELQSRIDAMEKDKIVLLARIEALTTVDTEEKKGPPPHDEIKTKAPVQPMSLPPQSVSGENLVRISPQLAETRRLNTLNASKYGHMNNGWMPLSHPLEKASVLTQQNGSVCNLKAPTQMYNRDNDRKMIHDPSEIILDSAETTPMSADEENDILQNAAQYIAEKFNF